MLNLGRQGCWPPVGIRCYKSLMKGINMSSVLMYEKELESLILLAGMA